MDDFERAWLCKVNINYTRGPNIWQVMDHHIAITNIYISIVTNSRKNIYIKKCGTISTN